MLLDLVDANHERDHKLMAALDALNGKMGKGTAWACHARTPPGTYAARAARHGGQRSGTSCSR